MKCSLFVVNCFAILICSSTATLGQTYNDNFFRSPLSKNMPHRTSIYSKTLSFTVSDVNISLSIQHPAILSLGEIVDVAVNYTTNYTGNIRVKVQPMTKDEPSHGYSSRPSEKYDARTGKATGHFTIHDDNVTVDHIQVALIAEKDTILFKKDISTSLRFSDNPIQKLDDTPSLSDAGKIKKIILPDGSIEITHKEGAGSIYKRTKRGFTIKSFITVQGRRRFQQVQTLTPPMPPDDDSKLQMLNNDLTGILKMIAGDEALVYYLKKEDEVTTSLYEKMQLKMEYIKKLL